MFIFLVTAVSLCIVALLGGRYIVYWARFLILACKIPGPKTVLTSFKDIELSMQKYFQEHPRLFVIWIGIVPMIILRDPRDIELVLGSGRKNIKKSFTVEFAKPLMGDGIALMEDAKWEQHRKLLAPAFNIKMLESYIEVFARKSEILVQKLEKEIGKNFDVSIFFRRAVIDLINETILETDLKSLDNNKDSENAEAIELGGKHVMKRIMSPWFYPDFIYWNSSSGKQCKKLVEFGVNFIKEVVNKRRQELKISNKSRQLTAEDNLFSTKKKGKFLDLLLEASEYGIQLSEMEIIDEIRHFVIAGYDTMKVALCWTMQILGNHPEIQDKIYEELENILQGSDRSYNMKDLSDMKYLERVIKEVLRLYPSLPVLVRAATRDFEIDGYTIPAGMQIYISIYNTHRNPEIYPDPEKFDPDRFLSSSVHTQPYTFLPFSVGSRNCIGQKYAMLKIKTILAYIIYNFKIHSMREKLTVRLEIVTNSEEGFYISISKRDPKNIT